MKFCPRISPKIRLWREYVGIEPTTDRLAARHWIWSPWNPPGPIYPRENLLQDIILPHLFINSTYNSQIPAFRTERSRCVVDRTSSFAPEGVFEPVKQTFFLQADQMAMNSGRAFEAGGVADFTHRWGIPLLQRRFLNIRKDPCLGISPRIAHGFTSLRFNRL